MRFNMSTDEKTMNGDPAPVAALPENPPTQVKRSQKKYVVIAVTGVIVVFLVLAAILVGMYLFTEAEKDIVKISLQLKNNMTQEVSSNPNTNVVLYHVNELNQETWIVDDFNSDLKVMKIQKTTGTNCYVTPLNESSPADLPKMESEMGQNSTGMVSVGYVTNGSPIKDNSFLSKAARDLCKGISTYWLYPRCENAADDNAVTPDPSKARVKRGTHSALCNGWLYESSCSFDYTCTAYSGYYCLIRTGTYYCYTFSWSFSWWDSLWNSCRMYRCSWPSGLNCVRA